MKRDKSYKNALLFSVTIKGHWTVSETGSILLYKIFTMVTIRNHKAKIRKIEWYNKTQKCKRFLLFAKRKKYIIKITNSPPGNTHLTRFCYIWVLHLTFAKMRRQWINITKIHLNFSHFLNFCWIFKDFPLCHSSIVFIPSIYQKSLSL